MVESAKYPRTFHLPFSPGKGDDDKVLESVDHFLGCDLIITEKMDGSNLCMTRDEIFARTHSGPPKHPSFDPAKALWASVRWDIPEGWSVFGEWCYAKHSIAYTALPAYFLVFGIRYDSNQEWASWDNVWTYAASIGLETVPYLWSGSVKTEKDLENIIKSVLAKGSMCGGEDIEGVVVRTSGEISIFQDSVTKWVRRDHITTDEHWMMQEIVPNKLRI